MVHLTLTFERMIDNLINSVLLFWTLLGVLDSELLVLQGLGLPIIRCCEGFCFVQDELLNRVNCI